MKNKTQFRIIYLKNDQPRKVRDENNKKYNMIQRATHPKEFIPNLVHLSARLQDDVYQQAGISERLQQLASEQLYMQPPPQSHVQSLSKKKEENIEKFIQQRQEKIKKQKNSIKNLIGSINLSFSNQRRHKKISLLKDKSKNGFSSRNLNNQQDFNNRQLLQTDFNTFLINKQAERTKKMPSMEQLQDKKVKKLSVINPQHNQEIDKQILIKPQPKQLNLFHFLSQRSQRMPKRPNNRKSSSAISGINSRSKIERNLFNFQTVLKTEQQQFDWSKVKRNEREYVAKLQ